MKRIHPTLIVLDVAASAAYYREKLGFEFTFPDQAAAHLQGDFAMLSREGVSIQLKAVPAGTPRPNPTVHEYARQDAFIDVVDPDALCAELKAKGVRIVSDVAPTPWGTREFSFADNSGYVFACGGLLPRA
jgi:catechol 2,3-dioxygenase-like lactoylglutathione lyase family enzyme